MMASRMNRPRVPGAATRTTARVLVLALAAAAIVGALFIPIGPPGCQGMDCYIIGPLTKALSPPPSPNGTAPSPGTPTTASATVTMLFPGTVTYTDGTSTTLSATQTGFAVLTGPSGKAVSKVSLQSLARVTTNVPINITVRGYVDEVASRASSDSLGAYYHRYSHTPESFTVMVRPPGATAALLSVNRTLPDFVTMSDLSASRNATHFNYALVGSINITLSSLINKTVSSVFAWPNSPVTLNAAGSGGGAPPGGGGGTGCGSGSARCVQVFSSQGVKFAWYAVGTAPTFSVADGATGPSILRLLGLR